MLTAIESTTADQDQLSVVYDHDPTAIISLYARAARARDPYGDVPPSSLDFSALLGTTITPLALGDLHSEVVKAASQKTEEVELEGFTHIHNLARWLAIGPAVTLPRGMLFRPDAGSRMAGASTRTIPSAARGPMVTALIALTDLNDSSPGSWPDDKANNALAILTLWASFARIRSAAYYSGDIDVPMGASRERYAEAVRIRRVVALLTVLQQSVRVAALREQAAWFTSPAVLPMLEHIGINVRGERSAEFGPTLLHEELMAHASAILSWKVHPWIAEAERMRLPSKQYTEWSTGTNCIGLAREGAFKELAAFARVRGSQGTMIADIREHVFGQIQKDFLPAVQEELLLRKMLDDSDVAQAEAALGLTNPTSPLQLHLHGRTWRALIMTGNMASEALPDALTLLTRPRFPLRLEGAYSEDGFGPQNGRVDLSGNADIYDYRAGYWLRAAPEDGTVIAGQPSSHRSLRAPGRLASPVLFVEPERPIMAEGYTLYQLTPEMIRIKQDGEYYGDEDSDDRTYSIEGAAQLLGYSDGGALLAALGTLGASAHLGHLFGPDAGGNSTVPLSKASKIFHSSRTRKPWRVRLELPTSGLPTQVIALNARTSPLKRDIQALVLRDFNFPTLPASTEGLADAIAQKAVEGLGGSGK